MARIMITGCAGFIGSNLCARLLQEGHEVGGVDNLSAGHLEFMSPLFRHRPQSWWMIDDFVDDHVLDLIKKQRFDVVIHLAAKPRVSYSVAHPLETHDINVNKTLQLIDACRGNIKRFVFASSSSVYGGAVNVHECQQLRPQSPYALQKMIIEQYLAQYNLHYGLESIALRFFNVFGPNSVGGGAYAMALTNWLTSIKEGTPMRSDGDGSQTRDMCYVDNTVQGIVKAATSPGGTGYFTPLNIACGKAVSNNEVLDYLQKRYPGAARYDAPPRDGDIHNTLASIEGARTLIGYEPMVDAMDGVERTCQWFDDNWEFIKKITGKSR